MIALLNRVRVAHRFQRSVLLETDIDEIDALEGFVCPESSADALKAMAAHIEATGQAAFTWTGPYGAGKSSLAVALANALGPKSKRDWAARAIGHGPTSFVCSKLPPGPRGWRSLAVTGRRVRPAIAIGEAMQRARFVRKAPVEGWDDSSVLLHLENVAKRTPRERGGLIVFIDEMGKFLESAAHDGTDIYIFQQLAELASRSNRRLVVIGILHQAFGDYARSLSRQMRDEWAKIQGRFADLAISSSPEEMLEIIGKAIEHEGAPNGHNALCASVAAHASRPETTSALESAWPLHPVTVCLLGPISRRRFGQNQRSVFGFLNSAEPLGFQDFLATADESGLYRPNLLWDYLRFNLEQSILASPDGHRWALAVDTITRCEFREFSKLHLDLLKTIALMEIFREQSRLAATPNLLNEITGPDTGDALTDLEDASLVIYRKFSDSYGLFDGSDFDIDGAVDEAREYSENLSFERLTELSGFHPIVAKRHYHETGALRWFRTAIVAPTALPEAAIRLAPQNGSAGTFILVLPMGGDSPAGIERLVAETLSGQLPYEPVIGLPQESSWGVPSLAGELAALEYVRDHTPELQGDRVARIEIEGRIGELRDLIERELTKALNSAIWQTKSCPAIELSLAQLNGLASDLADERFNSAPRIFNELLNRSKPSGNAIAAQNALLKHMVLGEGEPRLGIEGFPAEGGLFASVLEVSGLYCSRSDEWQFVQPSGSDPFRLQPAWKEAERVLSQNDSRTISVSEIWSAWRRPPFGIKGGLLPVITAAFMLSMRHRLAFYRDGIFQTQLTELDMQVLARRPNEIQLRWMVLPEKSRALLAELARVVQEMYGGEREIDLRPINVARGLIGILDELPNWSHRTRHVSANARAVRQMFIRARDPNRLIFDDIPRELTADGNESSPQLLAKHVRDGLIELRQAYPAMLHRLRESVLTALQVPISSASMLDDLRRRAANISGLGADHRQEAFAMRIARFRSDEETMEGLVSLAVSKPSTKWTDSDISHAAVALAEFARTFVHLEAFAHVQGRVDHRHAMAMVIGTGDNQRLYRREFTVRDSDQAQVDKVANSIEAAIPDPLSNDRDVVLAALAAVGARWISVYESED